MMEFAVEYRKQVKMWVTDHIIAKAVSQAELESMIRANDFEECIVENVRYDEDYDTLKIIKVNYTDTIKSIYPI